MSTSDSTDCALSLAPSRAPYRARARARLHEVAPTSTARRPARSERPAHSPFAATQLRPSRSAVPRSAGPERVKRWRRGHIHFSPAGPAPTGAEARPEWSVASDAEGGTRRAVRAVTYPPVQLATSLGEAFTVLVDSERARPPRPSPDPASTAGTRRAAAVAGCRVAEGFQESSPALAARRRHSAAGYSSRRWSNCET